MDTDNENEPIALGDAFDTLRTERLTESGKACIDIAEKLAVEARGTENVTEARHWVRLALLADNTELERKVRRLEELLLHKGRARGKAKAVADAAKAGGGNVLPMQRDAI